MNESKRNELKPGKQVSLTWLRSQIKAEYEAEIADLKRQLEAKPKEVEKLVYKDKVVEKVVYKQDPIDAVLQQRLAKIAAIAKEYDCGDFLQHARFYREGFQKIIKLASERGTG